MREEYTVDASDYGINKFYKLTINGKVFKVYESIWLNNDTIMASAEAIHSLLKGNNEETKKH